MYSSDQSVCNRTVSCCQSRSSPTWKSWLGVSLLISRASAPINSIAPRVPSVVTHCRQHQKKACHEAPSRPKYRRRYSLCKARAWQYLLLMGEQASKGTGRHTSKYLATKDAANRHTSSEALHSLTERLVSMVLVSPRPHLHLSSIGEPAHVPLCASCRDTPPPRG